MNSGTFQSSEGMNVIHAHPKNPELPVVSVFVRNITAKPVHIAKGTAMATCKVVATDWAGFVTSPNSAPKEIAAESPNITLVNVPPNAFPTIY